MVSKGIENDSAIMDGNEYKSSDLALKWLKTESEGFARRNHALGWRCDHGSYHASRHKVEYGNCFT